MNLQLKPIVILLFIIISGHISISAQIPKGTWREHLPYNQGKVVALAGNRVYCATEYALFYYNTDDHSVNKLSKINELSDLGIGFIAYSKEYKTLIIGYTNGNIDLLIDDVKYNFPDIKTKSMMTNKSIYHITIEGNKAYLSCGFGIVVFDLDKREISDTYIIGAGGNYKKINSTTIFQNRLYAFTEDGIYYGELDNPFLSNYQSWTKETANLNPNANYKGGVVLGSRLFVANNFDGADSSVVSSYDGNQWDTVFTNFGTLRSFSKSTNQMIIVSRWHSDAYDEQLNNTVHYGSYDGKYAVVDEDTTIWIADNKEGLIEYNHKVYKQVIYPSGPTSGNVFKIANNGGNMLVAPGGYQITGINTYFRAEIYAFSDGSWSGIDNQNNPQIVDLRDVCSFVVNGNKNHYFATTWGYGLIEVNNNEEATVYNADNTNQVLQPFVSGGAYDNQGNMWLVNRNAENPFVVMSPSGEWYHYKYNGAYSYQETGKVIQTQNDDFWTISARGAGIFVWNGNGTPDYEADDTYKNFQLKDEYAVLISSDLNDVVEDLEGVIWIGTSDGIAVYDYPQNVLAGRDFYARKPQLVVEGYLKGLLSGEKVTAIAVDGANRKWIGTEGGGLFLVSADGTQQLMILNTDNSPLFSNNIVALDINPDNGELFIGTDNGLMSYMTTSSGNKSDYSQIYSFPNPVKEGYNGLITIRGLMYQTNVKITDLAGHLVFETMSNGGDAIWNGKDMTGQRVHTGTYLVLCTNPDGSQSEVTKILFIR